MTAITPNPSRWPAVTLLAMSAALPAGVLLMYLFATDSAEWRHRFEVAMEPDGGARLKFLVLAAGAAVSTIAAIVVAASKHRYVLRGAFACATALALTYAAMGMWLFVLVSALPLWWAYKVAA